MSNEQENFDYLLRSKLDSAYFEFSESNWEKAEELIIQTEKKRKRRRIGLIFFVGLLLGICIMIPFTYEKGNNIHKPASDASINKFGTYPQHATRIETQKNAASQTDKPAIYSQNNLSVNKTEIEHLPQASHRKENESTSSEISGKPIKEMQAKNKERSKPKSVGNSEFYPKGNRGIMAGSSDKKNIPEKANKKESYKKEKRIENVKANLPIIGDETKKEHNSKSSSIENIANNVKEQSLISVERKDTVDVSGRLKNSLMPDSIIALKDTIITTQDSLAKLKAVDKENVKLEKEGNFKPSTFLSIDGGVMYSMGWAYPSTKEARGFNGVGGISLTWVFTKKISLLAGLQYNSLAHLNYSNYVSTNTQYGFGYTETKTIVTPTILYYLSVPVKLQFQLNDKNSLSIGANVLYLLNTSSKVENDTRSDFGAPSTTFTTKSGYRDGFSGWDLQPALAYRRKLYKAFSLSAEVYYGLIDLKNNAVFGQAKTERNSGLKLTLTYNLVHK